MTLRGSGSQDQPRTFGLGATTAIDTAGRPVCAGLPNPSTIGVADLTEVAEHRITRIFDSIAHHVRFDNGGELYYVFNRRGQIVELRSHALQVAISAAGDYLYRKSTANRNS
jgi:hypothetical protein